MTTTLDPAALEAAQDAYRRDQGFKSAPAVEAAITAYLNTVVTPSSGDVFADLGVDRPASLSPCDGEAVEVKALEWDPFRSLTPFGYYHIDDQTDRTAGELKGRLPFVLSGSRIDLSRHPSLEAAKAAAQADFERRIRSAVIATPAPREAVGECLACGVETVEGPGNGFLARCGRRVLSARENGCPTPAPSGAMAAAISKALAWQPSEDGPSYAETRKEIIAALSSKGETPEGGWCQPMDCGKHAPRKFIVRFADADRGDAVFDDEAEARAFWEKANTNWNCYLFGALPLPAAPKDKEGAK